MSQLQITNAGIDYRNAVFAGDEVQNITHFVFANIPGQDENAPIDANTTMPTNILHTQPIKAVSKVDGNAIVMSAVLGYDVGNFEYNWYGVVATKANNQQVLIAVVTTATQTKTKTVGPITGNYSVKSVLWRSQNIAEQLNVTLSALPWQVQEGELVSRADFDAHKHDSLYAKLTDITNTLTSTATNKPLSANQGRVLKGLVDNINAVLSSDDTTLDELQEIVNFIKQNKTTLNTLGVANIAGLQSALNAKQNALGYTPVQQGGGAGQGSNTVKIGWGGATENSLYLQVDNNNFGKNWPITSSNTTRLNGQLASYYATAEALSDAGVGTVSKDIDVINTLNVGGGFYRNPPSSAPDNGYSHWHTVFMDRTGDKQGAVIQVRDSLSTQIPSMYFRHRGSDGLWADAVEVQHSKNLATSAQIHSSLDYKAASAKAVKDFVDSRLSKPAVKHYYTTGNVTVNFGDAIKHIVTRFGSGNGTITLIGTSTAGDELVINNIRDDSGVATIKGRTMYTGKGVESDTTHTLTGQAKVTMVTVDTGGLMVTEVV